MALTEIRPDDISENPVRLIARDWMLITAGQPSDFNTMTASWGMIGEMWGLDVVECVVRPGRFTREYIDREQKLTLSFYPDSMRPLLKEMGTYSGREIDKMHFPGLEVTELPSGLLAFKGAKLIIEASVIYTDRFKPSCFSDPRLAEKWYDADDYHIRYIGRIDHVWSDV